MEEKEKDIIETDLNKNTLKNEVDNLINHINYNFHNNNIESSNFLNKQINLIPPNDPNKYIDFVNKDQQCYKNVNTLVTNNETKVEIKQNISINVEINSITDLLNLINKYNVEPSIKYNIDIQSLHNIKEHLLELNNMVGMKELKNNIVDQILYFIQELHKNKNFSGDFLHTVIYGPPGTGKTEIAKIIGKIYSKIGILSKGTFTKVTRSNLIAGYLGQTALKTTDVIKEALGGVLFIDEAYSLGSSEKKDSFAKECIDTLCEALSDNKENLMVIIAGYENELKENFFSYNQGLDSRFTWRFKTEKYTSQDLYKIFLKKVNEIGWEVDLLENTALEWFKKNYTYFNFYGRDIEVLLTKIKIAHSRRIFCKPDNDKRKINYKDLEKGFQNYLKNDYINSKKEEEEFKCRLTNTLYS
jgi:SpoVK/Ycf46/Vps4 family AAA+-type ATPase